MPVLDEDCDGAGSGGGVDDSDRRRRCSCLPFCFWGASSAGVPARRTRRRRRRLRLRLRLSWSWLAWPWFFRKGGKHNGAGGDGSKNKRRGRPLLLLLTASLQPKKALASVVSGGGGALLPAKVSTFGDARKQSNRKPRPAADDGPSGSRQPQASATASTRWTSTAPARSRTETSQPSPRPPDGAAVAAGRTWRAPSRRHSFHHRFDSTGRPGGAGGLWTAATTLGVIVLFGRVTAVVFLCSCLYGARFVRARAAGAMAKASSGGTGSSRRFGAVGVAAEKAVVEPRAAEEFKKKVVMAGLLDRAGQTPSSRFGR
ncbi:hypothetical protein GQ55_9G206000 [Panicum hallii var. hallii]|uniref:Uncharacterized protein n=1 Tax=Panicum hallii var. hallii TaxID=1504633 RepID=A0A2T7C5C2_9POAL|nr:hypothetical protein GQ55_9G206000 [Panicum hallii var. hallii]